MSATLRAKEEWGITAVAYFAAITASKLLHLPTCFHFHLFHGSWSFRDI